MRSSRAPADASFRVARPLGNRRAPSYDRRLRRVHAARLSLLLSLALLVGSARANERATRDEFDHRINFGFGGALELELTGVNVHGGVSTFVEWEVIENWLELELGVSALAAEGGVEIPIDLLIKKPFRLARAVEVMVGLGPELVLYRNTARDGAFFALEVAADFMFWPWRHVGFWLEPSYELTVRNGLEHSLASSGGLCFGW